MSPNLKTGKVQNLFSRTDIAIASPMVLNYQTDFALVRLRTLLNTEIRAHSCSLSAQNL